MGFADHPYCVVLQTHDPDSTDSAQESAYADRCARAGADASAGRREDYSR